MSAAAITFPLLLLQPHIHSYSGKCYTAANPKSLSQCMESLTQKLHPGVVVNFRRRGVGIGEDNGNGQRRDYRVSPDEGENGEDKEDKPTAWHNTRKMIYVRPNPKTNVPTGHWPIPESFWPSSSMTVLVSGLLTMFNIRTIVCYSCVEQVYNTAPLSPTHCGLARGQNKCILNQLFIHVLRQLKIGPVLISISAYISSCNQFFYFFLSMSSSVQCVCFDCNCGVSVVFI